MFLTWYRKFFLFACWLVFCFIYYTWIHFVCVLRRIWSVAPIISWHHHIFFTVEKVYSPGTKSIEIEASSGKYLRLQLWFRLEQTEGVRCQCTVIISSTIAQNRLSKGAETFCEQFVWRFPFSISFRNFILRIIYPTLLVLAVEDLFNFCSDFIVFFVEKEMHFKQIQARKRKVRKGKINNGHPVLNFFFL